VIENLDIRRLGKVFDERCKTVVIFVCLGNGGFEDAGIGGQAGDGILLYHGGKLAGFKHAALDKIDPDTLTELIGTY